MGDWFVERFECGNPNRVPVQCAECQRPMWLPPSKISLHRRCGPACSAVRLERIKEARRRECETCGAIFWPRIYQIQQGFGRVCSQRCNLVARNALLSEQSQVKATAKMRAKRLAGEVHYLRGEESPCWKGGPEAAAERAKQNGSRTASARKWRKANPDRVREFKDRRNGRKIGRLPRGTVKRIGEAQRWKCALCRGSIKKKYHVDHIIALAKDGEHKPSNIQLLCPSCNVRKSAKDQIDYMQSLGFLL